MASPAHPLVQTPAAVDATRATMRSLAIATASNTLGITAHVTYMYYLAPIALRQQGLAWADAVIFSLVAVAMGVAVVPAGRLADRIPRRYVMRGGLGLLAVAYAGIAFEAGLAPIVLGTVASGAGLALLFVSFQSYVADLLQASRRGAAYGRAGAFAVLASAAGPFLAALVFRATVDPMAGLRANALLFSAAGVSGILLSLQLPSVRTAKPAPAERGHWYEAARAAGPVAAVYVFMGAGYGMTAPYFTVHFLDALRFGNASWGYLLAAGTVASAVGSLLAGALGRRIRPALVALAGMAGLLASSLPFAFAVPLAALALGFIGRSFFATTVAPAMSTITMERARPSRRAESQAYASLAWNTGWATGGAVGGTLHAILGGALFPLGGALAFLGVAIGATILLRAGPREL